MLFQVIYLTVAVPPETAQTLAVVPIIVSLLMVVGLSMLRWRWYTRAALKQTEHTNQHGAGSGGNQAV